MRSMGSFVAVAGLWATIGAARAQTWLQVEDGKRVGADTNDDDFFGSAIAIDGDTLVVGAPDADPNERGAAYVFTRVNGGWASPPLKLIATLGTVLDFDHFGASVAIDGDAIVVGAPTAGADNRGAAYVFRRSGTTWTAEAVLSWPTPLAGEKLGYAVAIADRTIALGAPDRTGSFGAYTGSIGLFTFDAGVWSYRRRLSNYAVDDNDQLGRALAIERSSPTQYTLVAASLNASCAVYRGYDLTWSQIDAVGAWNARSVALSNGYFAVGEPYTNGAPLGSGEVLTYHIDGSGAVVFDAALYSPQGAAQNDFGQSVALDGDLLAVGEPRGDIGGTFNRGVVNLYQRSGASWLLRARIAASDGELWDEFGLAVAIAGSDVICGAPSDLNPAGSQAGAAYFVRVGHPTVTYCTPGVSGAACVATMSSTGIPSASLATGFTLLATGIDGERAGRVFYGASGAHDAPWNGASYLCVKSPLQRGPTHSSGGTAGACDGQLTLDWNAFAAAHPGALGQPFVTGQVFWAQGWYRDPLAVKSTQLSSALAFELQP